MIEKWGIVRLNYSITNVSIGIISFLGLGLINNEQVIAEESKATVETKGSINFQGIILPKNEPNFIHDDDKYQSWRMGNSGNLTVKYKHKFSDKSTIGAVSQFFLSTNFDNSLSTSELYVFVDTISGKFQLGSVRSAAEELKVDATSIQAQNTGIDTAWYRSANLREGDGGATNAMPFYVLPLLYGDYTRTPGSWHRRSSYGGAEAEEKSNKHKMISGIPAPKITYYTPEFNNFKLGISYIRKERIINNEGSRGDYKDILSGGIAYEEEITDNVTLKLALTGEKAQHEVPNKYYDLFGWNVGGQVSFAGFKAAASFANIGKSGLEIKPTITPGNTTYWTLGAAYEVGAAMLSLTYFHSTAKDKGENKEDILNNLSLGAHYHITGKSNKFTPYIGINIFNTKQAEPSKNNNKGTVFTTGLKVTF